jgi:hypothetical protein
MLSAEREANLNSLQSAKMLQMYISPCCARSWEIGGGGNAFAAAAGMKNGPPALIIMKYIIIDAMKVAIFPVYQNRNASLNTGVVGNHK